MDVKNELARKVENTGKVKLTKNMPIADMIKALEPEIARALPSVITPERFTRMALNALNNTPKLAECTQMSFLGALMNAAMQRNLVWNQTHHLVKHISFLIKTREYWNVSFRLVTKDS